MHHLWIIPVSVILSTVIGGFAGLKFGGIYSDSQGVYNVSRPRLAMVLGGLIALVCAAVLNATFVQGAVSIGISVFTAKLFCRHLFYRYMWKRDGDGN